MGMLAEERRMHLVEWTRSAGLVDANEAADKLAVAVETVRRDLDVLQRRGLLRRVHGGAIATEKFAHEFTIPERENRSPQEKQQIADVASKYIPEEGAIIVDGGTTCAALGPYLLDKPNLLVITKQRQTCKHNRRIINQALHARRPCPLYLAEFRRGTNR